jgi:hypothetical protein
MRNLYAIVNAAGKIVVENNSLLVFVDPTAADCVCRSRRGTFVGQHDEVANVEPTFTKVKYVIERTLIDF